MFKNSEKVFQRLQHIRNDPKDLQKFGINSKIQFSIQR